MVRALFNDDVSVLREYKDEAGIHRKDMRALALLRFKTRNFDRLFRNEKTRREVAAEIDAPKELADMFVTVQQARYANRTQTAEMSGVFRDIKGSLKGQRYDESLCVMNMLATEKGKTDEQMRQAWGFTWKEAHEELVTNPAIQKTVDMQGARHYIHHTHAAEMEKLAAELITELEKSA